MLAFSSSLESTFNSPSSESLHVPFSACFTCLNTLSRLSIFFFFLTGQFGLI
ncbi:hypothetical protein LguiA_031286 [Lonicera macranthoides]